ncbi:MAG: hypothetical protein GX874_06255 [Smithella sp.]|nr:hypothetical protein [Smithella sp.]
MVNSAVNEKDLIVTGDGASAVMTFTDDSTITLSPKTRLRVKEFGAADTTGAAGTAGAAGGAAAGGSSDIPPTHTVPVHPLKRFIFRKITPFISNSQLVKGDFLFSGSVSGWRTKIQNCFCI